VRIVNGVHDFAEQSPKWVPGKPGLGDRRPVADIGAMWTYVLRYRILLRAIYARSTAA
jgi:hypothetical protein